MNPRPYVQLQTLATLLATVITLNVLGEGVALAVSLELSTCAAIWLVFFLRYRWLTARTALDRSDDRASKDAVMMACFAVGLFAPTTLAWSDVASGGIELFEPPLKGAEAVIMALSVLAVPLSILVSSAVDWYLIRPFCEGVHGDPVCQASPHDSGRALDYARYWVLHRMLSEFFVYVAIVGVIAVLAIATGAATDSETGKNLLSLLGFLGIAVWSLTELGKLRPALAFVRFPTCGLGDWVTGRNDEAEDIAGFVLDVAIDPGVQLITEPRGHPARDISDPDRSVPLKNRRSIKPIPALEPTCPGMKCAFWLPACEVGLRSAAHATAEPTNRAG